MSLLFFDMEFTGLHKNTTPISMGIVSEDGKRFYAEFSDYAKTQCNDWIVENVTSELLHDKPDKWHFVVADRQVYGDKKHVHYELEDWLQQFGTVQFVSDVCHYDFVLLIDILTSGKTALDLPLNISPICIDLNNFIAQHFDISNFKAFDLSRENIMYMLCGENDIVFGKKHNSLYDAEVIRAIWKEIGRDGRYI